MKSLNELYIVDSECPSGLRSKLTGKPVGAIDKWTKGTQYYKVSGKRVHRVIWEITYGQIPDGMEVDHIDRNSLNNHLDNLRLVSKGLNQRNKPCQTNNVLGEKNITVNEYGNYRVRTMLNGRTVSKTFKSLPEAVDYRDSMEVLHGVK